MIDGFSRIFLSGAVCCTSLFLASPAVGQVDRQTPIQTPSGDSASTGSAAAAAPNAKVIGSNEGAYSQQPVPSSPPTQPEWWPLPQDQAEHVSQLLDYWQQSSDQVHQCTCDFTRWDYDPTYCNYRDPKKNYALAAFAVWRGQLRFAAPDKAYFETTEVWKFKLEKDTAELEKSEDQNLKLKWLCDGKCVYDYNFINKVLTDIPIPVEFQGEGLVNSPLPFLFGANRETMLNRYWIRPITPTGVTEEYWLEVIPRRLEDTRTYSRVELVIARQDFLPKSMVIFSPNYDPKTNQVSQAYLFENRKINGQLAAVQDFFDIFIRPKVPFGWTRVEQKPLTDDNITAQKEELERSNRK